MAPPTSTFARRLGYRFSSANVRWQLSWLWCEVETRAIVDDSPGVTIVENRELGTCEGHLTKFGRLALVVRREQNAIGNPGTMRVVGQVRRKP